MLNSLLVSFLSPNTNTGPLRKNPKQTQLKENQKSQQKSIHLKKRQKRHPRSAQQKGEKKAEKPNKKMARLTYWQNLLRDVDHFARRMCLQYIFHGENTKPHPFQVKSTSKPQVQLSVALESYSEEVKIKLAELELKNPKDNLTPAERETLNTQKRDTNINFKKADKGTTSVVLNIEDKVKEGQTKLDNREHYRPLVNLLVFNSLLADSVLETT